MENLHSIFSFTGTKYRLIDFLKANIEFDDSYQYWYEPFCGSCVVGLNFQPRHAFFNDINCHLMGFYRFICWCHSWRGIDFGFNFKEAFETYYVDKLRERGSEFYYQVRDEFNKKWREIGSNINFYHLVDTEQDYPPAWLVKFLMDFFFLCQSGFSHQLRYNRKGELNMAYSKFAYLLDEKTREGLYQRLKQFTDFANGDESCIQFAYMDWRNFLKYTQETMEACNHKPDKYFIYCDPPYVGTIQDYITKDFGEQDLKDMLRTLENMRFPFAISGSCSDEDKEKTIEFYKGHRVVFKDYQYNMNSKGAKTVNEYLVLR